MGIHRRGQPVHLPLFGGGVIVGGCAVFIQRVQQRLSVLQRFGVGLPGQGGAVVGADRVARRAQHVVCTIPTPFGVQRLIQRRGVHAGRGDQVVDGGRICSVEFGQCLVNLCLCHIFIIIDSLCFLYNGR